MTAEMLTRCGIGKVDGVFTCTLFVMPIMLLLLCTIIYSLLIFHCNSLFIEELLPNHV